MAQNYLWKVTYEQYGEISTLENGRYVYYEGDYGWISKSKVFGSKLSAMSFANKLENNTGCKNIRIFKWK